MKWYLAMALSFCSAGCGLESWDNDLAAGSEAITQGTADTQAKHQAVVALTTSMMLCSGTLITPTVVVTAAHCVESMGSSRTFKVVFGSSAFGGTSRTVSKSLAHPDYNTTTLVNDIGLVWLSSAAPADVTPIPYLSGPWGLTVADEGTPLEFSGFGATETGSGAGTKRHVNGIINAVMGDTASGVFPAHTFNFNLDNGGTCEGDSGGPAFVRRRNIEFVAGATSAGISQDCTGYGWDTDVSAFASWIATQLGASGSETACADSQDSDGDGLTDCADPDCANAAGCTLPAEDCFNGVDDDQDAKTDCKDTECRDLPSCIPPEDCANKVDDDGDGLIDCKDPDCAGELVCVKEICDNGVDDDGDGKIDCKDYIDCASAEVCNVETKCDNGIDDDMDGDTDCADKDCASLPVCQPNHEVCTGGIDEDGDGFTDCDDNDCAQNAACQTAENCTNNLDDDGDGYTDCDDNDCAQNAACKQASENCQNGVDDDGDGAVDCNDADCANNAACKSTENCQNGVDDDGDSYADCDDVDCAQNAACQTTAENCFNQVDDDGDGLIDCADPTCASAAGCGSVEICGNGVDDDGNGAADCQDAPCATYAACQQAGGGGGGCAQAGGTPAFGALALMLLGLVLWLRRDL